MKPIRVRGLANEVYDQLRLAIFTGELPMGARIDTDAVASALGVSKQPVKEALARLQVEGLIVIRARSGTFVRTVTLDDARNLLSVREMMETFALRHIKRWDHEAEEALAAQVHAMRTALASEPFDWVRYNTCDQTFHEGLVALAGNPELDRAYRALHSHFVSALFYFGRRDKAMVNDPDHARILDALRAGDVEQAAELAAEHIRSAIVGLPEAWARLVRDGRLPSAVLG